MNIVIVGDGKVGYALASGLSKEAHNLTVIDSRPEALRNTINGLDVNCIVGNGVSYRVQTEAGVPKADLLIAAASTDEINMLSCMVAHKLGAKHTIARVRDPQYQQQMFFLKDELGLDFVVNPEQATAAKISRLLRFVPAVKAEPFAKGRIELVEFNVREESSLCGLVLSELYERYRVNVLVCAVRRAGRVIIPKGNFEIKAGDKLSILSSPANISSFFRAVGVFQKRVKDVMIVGGGRIAYYLARQLIDSGMRVKVIEKNAARCEELCNLLPRAVILNSDGTDPELLHEEGLDDADALITLTGIDEENIILAMYANSRCVDKVIAKVNNDRIKGLLSTVGIESVISPKEIAVDSILSYVRAMTNADGSSVETLYRVADGSAEALEFRVREGSRCIGGPLKDLPIRNNMLIGAIMRGNTCIIPSGGDSIRQDDCVIVVTSVTGLQELDSILKDA